MAWSTQVSGRQCSGNCEKSIRLKRKLEDREHELKEEKAKHRKLLNELNEEKEKNNKLEDALKQSRSQGDGEHLKEVVKGLAEEMSVNILKNMPAGKLY